MTFPLLVDIIQGFVTENTQAYLAEVPLCEMASLTEVQALGIAAAEAAGRAVFAAWNTILIAAAKDLGLDCPCCGHRRKCKTRPKDPLRITVLGMDLELPKLYLECGHCDAPGVSITVLFTGLSSGEASLQLKLNAAHFAAKHSYGESQKDMAAHYGQDIERTKLRRMAMQVEKRAVDYAEAKRAEALQRLSGEARVTGVPTLMVEADGGMIRTGERIDLDPEDPGYGEETKRGKPRRKRPTHYRELITMDVREPGEMEPTTLDVLVPVGAPQGERSRRLLALAGRAGLGDNTHVKGLGDLGSGLPAAFDEAFVGYQADFSADWKHICDYVKAARKVLCGLDADAWAKQMRNAIWDREEDTRDRLLGNGAKAPHQGAAGGARQVSGQGPFPIRDPQLAPHALSTAQSRGTPLRQRQSRGPGPRPEQETLQRRRRLEARKSRAKGLSCAPSSTKANGSTSSAPSWPPSKAASRRRYRLGSNEP